MVHPMTNDTIENWTLSESADDFHRDQEIDLGDGWHACVYPLADGGSWGWELWEQWLHSDDDGENYPIDRGICLTEDIAKGYALGVAAHYGRTP